MQLLRGMKFGTIIYLPSDFHACSSFFPAIETLHNWILVRRQCFIMYTKNLNPTLSQWIERTNPLVAYYAITQAHQAICLHELACFIQANQLEPYLTRQIKENWLQLGKSHLQVMVPLIEALSQQPFPEVADLSFDAELYIQAKYGLRPGGKAYEYIHDRYGDVRNSWALYKRFNEDAVAGRAEMEERMRVYVSRMLDASCDPFGDPLDFISQPYAAYFLRVFVPCLLESGLPYGIVHVCARRGNRYAMECVLRNNPVALQDKIILDNFNNSKTENPVAFRGYQKALKDGPIKHDISPMKAKAFIGAHIYEFAKNMAHQIAVVSDMWKPLKISLKPYKVVALSVKDIYCLFNAIEEHVSRGKRDSDLDLSCDNTFKIAVDRMRQSLQQVRISFGLRPSKFYTLQ